MGNYFILVLLWLVFGIITSNVASTKGRDPFIWFFLGILGGWIALLVVFLLPAVEERLEGTIPQDPISEDPEVGQVIDVTSTAEEMEPVAVEEEDATWFFLNEEHEQQGPVTESKLQELFDEGKLSETSYVWRDGMEEWKPLKESGLEL